MELDSLQIDYKNLEKNNVKNYINFKPNQNTNLEQEYLIILCSNKKLNVQFKFNFKFVKDLEIISRDKKFLIKENNYDGILVNGEIGPLNKIQIKFKPIDYCGSINIWDVKLFNPKVYTKITWDKVYIINLKRRSDRKKIMIEKLKKIGLTNYEFINAVDGLKLKVSKVFDNLKNKNKTQILNYGHFGCILSHIKVLKNAILNNYNRVMILEDDIEFPDDFIEKINNINVPEFNILYLGGPIKESKLFIDGWGIHNEIMGTYGYILDSKIFKDVLNAFSELKYSADITLIESIQSNFNTILLNDLVKTKIEDSDTSAKSNIMSRMVLKLNTEFYTESKL